MKPTVVMLTYNSSASIRATLEAVRPLTDDIHVVDSGSADDTVRIAQEFGAKIYDHPFVNYGAQRNWAIDRIEAKYGWQLHLDADERISAALREEILALEEEGPGGGGPGGGAIDGAGDGEIDGYFIARYLCFMNRVLRHNLAPTWHMRLFRTGRGRCEDRNYDQHFICAGQTRQLRHSMIDDIQMSLSEWTARHNRWSDAEVKEILARQTAGRVESKLTGNVVERKRFLRAGYDRVPRFIRPLGLFFYRYVLTGGFLDGMEGLIFCVLQTFWFRFLVDAKLFEAGRAADGGSTPGPKLARMKHDV